MELDLADDLQVFDGLENVDIIVSTGNGGNVDFTTRTAVHTKQTLSTVGLFRQRSDRSNGSVRNLRDREMALQLDAFNKSDTIVEIPFYAIPDVNVVKHGDVLIRKCDNTKWTITGVDASTLLSRYRIGVSKMQ